MNINDLVYERLLDRKPPGEWAIRPLNVLLPSGELAEGLDIVIDGDSIARVSETAE